MTLIQITLELHGIAYSGAAARIYNWGGGGGGGGGKPSRNCYLILHLKDKIEKRRYTNTFQKLNLCVTLIKLTR